MMDPLVATNALLRNIVLSDGLVVSPEFSSDLFEYQSLASNLTSFRIQPQIDAPGSTVSIGGVVVEPDQFSAAYPLELGSNSFQIVVTSDGELDTKTYRLEVFNTTERLFLSTLRVNDIENNPIAIEPALLPSTTEYNCTLVADKARVTAATLNPMEEISVTQTIGLVDTEIAFTDPYYEVDIPIGESSLSITVTSAESDNSREYTLNMNNVLGSPSDISLVPQGYTRINTSWAAADDQRVSRYLVVRSSTVTEPFVPENTSYIRQTYPYNLGNGYSVAQVVQNTTAFDDSGLTDNTEYYYTVYSYYADGNDHYYSPNYVHGSATTVDYVPPEPDLTVNISSVTLSVISDTYDENPDFDVDLGFNRPDGTPLRWQGYQGDVPAGGSRSHSFGAAGEFTVRPGEMINMRWYVWEEDQGTYWDETGNGTAAGADAAEITYDELKAAATIAEGTGGYRGTYVGAEASRTKEMSYTADYGFWSETEKVNIRVTFGIAVSYTPPDETPPDEGF